MSDKSLTAHDLREILYDSGLFEKKLVATKNGKKTLDLVAQSVLTNLLCRSAKVEDESCVGWGLRPVWPGASKIESDTGLSRSGVYKGIEELKAAGLITVHKGKWLGTHHQKVFRFESDRLIPKRIENEPESAQNTQDLRFPQGGHLIPQDGNLTPGIPQGGIRFPQGGHPLKEEQQQENNSNCKNKIQGRRPPETLSFLRNMLGERGLDRVIGEYDVEMLETARDEFIGIPRKRIATIKDHAGYFIGILDQVKHRIIEERAEMRAEAEKEQHNREYEEAQRHFHQEAEGTWPE